MARANEGPTLQKLVALLDNLNFIADAKDYHRKFTTWYFKTAPSERERQLHVFDRDVIEPFIEKWGAWPPEKNLLVSPSQYKTHYAVTTGLWGIISVFPWTTRTEIEKHTRRIHRAIGRKHKDFLKDRRAQIVEWLSWHCNSATGKAPRRSDIAVAVWGRTKGLKRPSKAQVVSKLSNERESEMMTRYLAKGMSYREADRAVMQQLRGKEAPASAMVRMAMSRLKRERAELEKEGRVPRKTDKAGYALTLLLREILFSGPAHVSIDRVRTKAANLANILTRLDSQNPRT